MFDYKPGLSSEPPVESFALQWLKRKRTFKMAEAAGRKYAGVTSAIVSIIYRAKKETTGDDEAQFLIL